jgi:hypothetical protein
MSTLQFKFEKNISIQAIYISVNMTIMHTTFVASYLPPNPTSIMQTSTCIEFNVKWRNSINMEQVCIGI